MLAGEIPLHKCYRVLHYSDKDSKVLQSYTLTKDSYNSKYLIGETTMKFKKTAMAVAIAGIAVAPMAQADVTLSGYIGVILGGSDSDVMNDDGTTAGDPLLSSDDSSLNVSASHTMNNGLTGYGNYRLDSGLTGSSPAGDNIWVGMKGGFGDIRIGEVPDALEYGQVAGDILADIGGENQGISYTGAFGPVTLGLNWSPQRNSDHTGVGVKFSLGGFAIGVGAGDTDGISKVSAGASFSYAGASIGVAMKDFDNDRSTIGAKVGYSISGVSLGLTFEAESGDVNDGDAKVRFDAGYGLGGGMDVSFRANIFSSDDAAKEVTDYRVLLSKSF